MAYDADGNVTQTMDANSNVSTATYDRAGRKLLSIDALGDTASYFYDAWGRVTSVNAPPAAGNALYRMVQPDSVHHAFLTANLTDYNNVRLGGYAASLGPLGGVYTDSSQAPGLAPLYRLYSSNNGEHFYTTDTGERSYMLSIGYVDEPIAGYVFTAPAPDRKPLYRAYNSSSYQHLYTDNVDEYNALPAPWSKEGIRAYLINNTVRTTYDFNSNVLTVTDPNGITGASTYDADDRPVTSSNGRGDTVHLYYDQFNPGSNHWLRGMLTTKVDGNGRATGYDYTDRGEPWWVQYPDGRHEESYYDENGNVTLHKDGKGANTTYAYDIAGRLTQLSYLSNNTGVSFTYDAANRQTQMNDSLGATTWGYDAAGRLTQLNNPYAALSYGYDAANRRVSMTLNSVSTWSYAYDNGGRLVSQRNPLNETTSYSYYQTNRLNTRTDALGSMTSYGYNGLGLTVGVYWGWTSNNIGTGWQGLAYDAGGRLVYKPESDGSSILYGYDGAGQLTSENRTGYIPFTAAYDYDSNGNRLHKTWNGQTDTYAYYPNSDRLQTVSGAWGSMGYAYDGNGNCTSIQQAGQAPLSMVWNPDNTMASLTYPSGAVARFGYNGLGLRLSSTDGGVYHDATDGAAPGSPLLMDGVALYTPGVSESRGGQSRFHQPDALGSTRRLLSSDWGIADIRTFDAWGNTLSHGGTATNALYGHPSPFEFGGSSGYQSDASGLVLCGSRYYDPGTGRFISEDPAGAGHNWYAYCGNDPTGAVDPTGLVPADLKPNGMYPTANESLAAALDYYTSSGDTFSRDVYTVAVQQPAPVGQALFDTYSAAAGQNGTGFNGYGSYEDAAKAAKAKVMGNSDVYPVGHQEFYGLIGQDPRTHRWYFSGPFPGDEGTVNIMPHYNPDYDSAWWHTHPVQSKDGFSNLDVHTSISLGLNAYVFSSKTSQHDWFYRVQDVPANSVPPDRRLYTGPGVTQLGW